MRSRGRWVSLTAVAVAGLALALLVDLPWPIRVAIIAGAAILVAVPLLLDQSARRDHRRHLARVESWAAGEGLAYEPEPGRPHWVRWLPWRPHATLGPALAGEYQGRRLTIAEYARSRPQPHGGVVREAMIVCVVPLSRAHPDIVVDLPTVTRWWPGRQVARFRTGDIAFDRRFRVRAADPDDATLVLGPQLRAKMLARELPPWEIHETDLIVTWPQDLRPEDLPDRLADALRLVSLIEAANPTYPDDPAVR